MWTVIRRELKTYFYTPAAYVFLSVFWLIGGIFFYLYNTLASMQNFGGMRVPNIRLP